MFFKTNGRGTKKEGDLYILVSTVLQLIAYTALGGWGAVFILRAYLSSVVRKVACEKMWQDESLQPICRPCRSKWSHGTDSKVEGKSAVTANIPCHSTNMFFAHIIAIQFAYSHCVPPLKFKGIENTQSTKPTFVLEWICILLQGVLSVRFLENKLVCEKDHVVIHIWA